MAISKETQKRIEKEEQETTRLVEQFKTIEEKIAFVKGMQHQCDRNTRIIQNVCDTTQ